ncbi:hypothetical protein SCH01S_45_00350 [Sphingomonas changbaiensis NBRC 104936]|uniref:Flippase-like domain-containing protein n=1 Tax=Sphingomonas changbaiensis NBRC 104936 TaxID=1219043 RepID=A0A0E9MQY4_9SPHN|nr:hypothetical protein [Sphingomonas changbaiensis]GAO40192.1 hypothetical protein SCH01S_45_00350 [Sphingomonas changbaiensis NBRC 104936]
MYFPEATVPAPAQFIELGGAERSGPLDRLKASGPIAWIGAAITLGVLCAVLWQLRTLHIRQILEDIPRTPVFWMLFGAYYVTAPLADWIIFRRLWRIPAAGFAALTRKLIGNELLLGYSGELHFYSWARSRTDLPGAPFGAIKDVAILSAVVGNVTTLAMLAFAYPAFVSLNLGMRGGTFALSVGIILLSSLAPMLFRRRLFGLARADLLFISAVHFARIVTMTTLAALMWHVVLPGQPVGLWLLLATMRLLISRLPLLPNKDLVFAGIAVLMMGHDVEIGTMMTMIATLILTTHLTVGAALVGSEIASWGRR